MKLFLKVAILVDPMGLIMADVTPEQEFESHCAALREAIPEGTLKFERLYCFDAATVDADIVVFDFGGMMMGNDLLGSNARQLIRWMQDHPSALVVVVSQFSYNHGIEHELEAQSLSPGQQLIVGDDALNRSEVRRQIRTWLGLKETAA